MYAFDFVFDDQQFRLQGVPDWSSLPALGRANLYRLLTLAEARSLAAADLDRDERRHLITAIHDLRRLAEESTLTRPILPRLRAGAPTAAGGSVVIYMGDTPGWRGPEWVAAVVADVVKDFKREWSSAKEKGYYWRITASLVDRDDSIAYTTSEPRVLSRRSYRFLKNESDPEFLAIFVENAKREWQPLWCIEAGTTVNVEQMDYRSWLKSTPEAVVS